MSALVVCIPNGINLRNALRIAEQHGCRVECVRRTGEMRISHRFMRKSCKVNARRKDCPRHLVVWLRAVAEQPC